MSFVSAEEQSVGAYMLRILTGPEEVERCRERILGVQHGVHHCKSNPVNSRLLRLLSLPEKCVVLFSEAAAGRKSGLL